jgi:molybdenum cofactor cytidylyltransferase
MTADGADLGAVTGLVLAAGASRRLGRPKQLLPYAGATLLDATLETARRCGFGQLLVALGGAADQVEKEVDLSGAEVVRNPAYGEGCSSSIAAALPAVRAGARGLVLLLGDQPTVRPADVAALVAVAGASPVGVTAYEDGIGHPFWLGRPLFGDLAALHGDKGVWKLVDRAGHDLVVHRAAGPVPPDVDTWSDYQHLVGLTSDPEPVR